MRLENFDRVLTAKFDRVLTAKFDRVLTDSGGILTGEPEKKPITGGGSAFWLGCSPMVETLLYIRMPSEKQKTPIFSVLILR